MIALRLVVIAIVLLTPCVLYGQSNSGFIKGSVSDQGGASIPFASIYIDTLKVGASCDEKGHYRLENIPPGTYKVSASLVGYRGQSKMVLVPKRGSITVNFSMDEDARSLNNVIVSEKSEVQKVREQAFTVNSIDVKPLHNLNMDVNTVLNRSTGIRIRQDGGLGSGFNFSLNGFSGNQVRFFIDGLPADFLGAAMSFNNIPVNIIERIEVYKGVVPVELGADALGGAVNIITNSKTQKMLDVNYSYGSFNTHRASLVSRNSIKNHLMVNSNLFLNYSDNSYTVDVQARDPNTGMISEPFPVKLFNESFISGSGMVEGGFVNTHWADFLLVGMTISGSKKNYQRGQSMTTEPRSGLFSKSTAFSPSLKYKKNDLFVKDLLLNLSANYTYERFNNTDTTSRIYQWDGTSVPLTDDKGNSVTTGSITDFYNQGVVTTATLSYQLGKRHTFTANNTYSYARRVGEELFKDYTTYDVSFPFENPNVLSKNVSGLSYKFSLWDNRWNTTVFAKGYSMRAALYYDDDPTSTELKKMNRKQFNFGEGIATSLFVDKNRNLLVKASYENAARMPETNELLGDGLFITPNQFLKPEISKNFNIGVLYAKRFDRHGINAETGLIYRLPRDLIRLVAAGPTGHYENLNTAVVRGIEGTVRYDYKRLVNVELNATWQDMRNNNKVVNNYPDPLYKDRIPNTPYLFGNAIIGCFSPEMGAKKYRVGVNWATMYVEEFYLRWPSMGSRDTKYIIPTQLTHDVSLTLGMFSGKYNLSLSCQNLADSKLYDNYKIQKPGRSFTIKLRCFLSTF